ncbi:hypothetical protein Bxe_A1521 [Paraburkholderia xenovorans LB400]|uniref:Uncharacterized protein n=1 Tax=Paraburkholderia xenovorans (strain LB400) TaxID=266265 RepID=Q13WV6_PARXL|nr:hypothetical protein Bxe_A1521 [Paraburkholderia xenovorans LB400]
MRKFGAKHLMCTKIRRVTRVDLANAQIWCANRLEEFGAACRSVRPFPANARAAWSCAGLAHAWHRSCFIGADRFVRADFYLRPHPLRGGRAGTGQLDWAAAESAEFVNQEIGYE